MSTLSMDLAWIVVNDFKAAVKFYTEVVGLQLMECHDQWGWAELQGQGGARLGIATKCEGSQIDPGQNAVLTFTVKNLDQAKAEMAQKGAVFVGEIQEVPDHVRMQLLKDADGNQFQIVQVLYASKT
jgi:predicted enzyme related to lactoylglutathione lyase